MIQPAPAGRTRRDPLGSGDPVVTSATAGSRGPVMNSSSGNRPLVVVVAMLNPSLVIHGLVAFHWSGRRPPGGLEHRGPRRLDSFGNVLGRTRRPPPRSTALTRASANPKGPPMANCTH